MARIIILGSAAAVADAEHDNTHFILEGDTHSILVDCGSNPLGKIHKLGINDNQMQHMILTHFHPDHVSGVPNMLMHMWLLGRTAPLCIYGLDHCIDRVEIMLDSFSWHDWPNFFPVTFQRIAEANDTPVMDNDDFVITSTPTRHFIPTMGLRVFNKRTGKLLSYTCDSEPIPELVDIGRGADIFIHEASGRGPGHCSARDAGETATAAGAKSLYLIHYQVWNTDPTPLISEAQRAYDGPVFLAQDFDEYLF